MSRELRAHGEVAAAAAANSDVELDVAVGRVAAEALVAVGEPEPRCEGLPVEESFFSG